MGVYTTAAGENPARSTGRSPDKTINWLAACPIKLSTANLSVLYRPALQVAKSTAGSTDWPHGLVGREEGEVPKAFVSFSASLRRSLDGAPDKIVEKITRNVLDRFSAKAPPPPPASRASRL